VKFSGEWSSGFGRFERSVAIERLERFERINAVIEQLNRQSADPTLPPAHSPRRSG
jgi:hypothetical protein